MTDPLYVPDGECACTPDGRTCLCAPADLRERLDALGMSRLEQLEAEERGDVVVEIVRPLFDAHNRAQPKAPISFFDSVRTLAFFIDRVAKESSLTGESVAVGFFRSGAPGLARIRITEEHKQVTFVRPAPRGYVAIPIGTRLGSEILLRGMTRALDERRNVIFAALGLMNYMAHHDGATFASIGGGLSVGLCKRQDPAFVWPPIEIAGRRYMRGLDVTSDYRGAWPVAERIEYDEAWCASVEQSAQGTPFGDGLMVPEHGVRTGTTDLDAFVAGDEAFRTHEDPDGF